MPVIQRNRSIFERLTGAGRPPPPKFDPYRSASRPASAAAVPAAPRPSPWGRGHTGIQPTASPIAESTAAAGPWLIIGVFAASVGVGLLILFWGRVSATVQEAGASPIFSYLLAAIPGLFLLFQAQKMYRWILERIFQIATYRPTQLDGHDASGPARLEQNAGRGVTTIVLVMLLASFGFPIFDTITRMIGISDWPIANLLPLAAIIALMWHRHGTPPWAKS